MAFELYETLGLNRSNNPSVEDVKKAYKINAMKYHPDKNKGNPEAETKFKQISHAYDILSDENKKMMYDRTGVEDNGSGNQGMSRGDMFEHIFRSRRGHGSMFGDFPFGFDPEDHTDTRVRKDIHRQYNISLDDVFNGVEKSLNITITKHCHECLKVCSNCNGTGVIKQMKNLGVFTQIFQAECDRCSNGYTTSPQPSCQKCKGKSKYTHESHNKLILPKGVQTGFTKVFKEMGEQPRNSKDKAGNLVFDVNVVEHSDFKRNGNDLIYKMEITFIESIVGKIIEIPYFNGEKIVININSWGAVHSGKQYMIQNKGLPIMNTTSFGNMFVEFTIKYPKHKNLEKLNELEAILKEVFD